MDDKTNNVQALDTSPKGEAKLMQVFDGNPKVTIISPHYDDLPLSVGGLILRLKDELNIIYCNVFSRSQFVAFIVN